MNKLYPVIDMHCDLLSYLATAEGAHPEKTADIGCAIPHLRAGNVAVQVMAIWTAGGREAPRLAAQQVTEFQQLEKRYPGDITTDIHDGIVEKFPQKPTTGIVAAIENGSCLCTADEPLESGLERLTQWQETLGQFVYISLTHHLENRFGGGNKSTVGLHADGRALLEYLSGKRIALDLSHASDALAYDALNWIDKKQLDVPILASHSNFRRHCDHPRNLPDELAREIITRDGLIGINFIRWFVSTDDPAVLFDHIAYGLELDGEHSLCLGADFCSFENYDGSRGMPFWPEHENAGVYPRVLDQAEQKFGKSIAQALAHANAAAFLRRLWDI